MSAVCSLAFLASGCSDNSVSQDDAIAEAAQTCVLPPANGTILSRDPEKGTGPHTVSIVNSDAGNTIVNVREASSNALVLSFFVVEGAEAAITDIPDGNYRIQYATGGELDQDCKSFAGEAAASQDPEIVAFEEGQAMTLAYELTPVADGNFDGQSIDPATFEAD